MTGVQTCALPIFPPGAVAGNAQVDRTPAGSGDLERSGRLRPGLGRTLLQRLGTGLGSRLANSETSRFRGTSVSGSGLGVATTVPKTSVRTEECSLWTSLKG